MRGGDFSEEKSPPSRSPQETGGRRRCWGEAASLREAPLPQTPSPEEQLGIGLPLPADLRAHASCGCSLIDLVESTAADRAAADMRRVGTHMERLQQLCSCWSLSHAVLEKPTHSFPPLAGRGGSVSRRDLNQAIRKPRPTHRRNQLRRNNPLKRQPLFGREGSGGRGASLREAASPPSVSPPHTSLREGARGRRFSLEKRPPTEFPYAPFFVYNRRWRSSL